MRSLVVHVTLALALATPAAAQDRAQERRALGADSLFGPGIVDLSTNGSAVKLRLTRPAHVVVFALRDTGVARLVLPRRAESRLSRAGDQWIDLPWSVWTGGGVTTTTFRVGRVDLAGAIPPPAGVTAGPQRAMPTVALVLVSDSAWTREEIVRLLPQEPPPGLMALAHNIATALLGPRAEPCAAYLVRW